jgi:hypothetical protein
MGTQRSSDGPGSGVPLIPTWVLPIEVPPEEVVPGPPEGTPEKPAEGAPEEGKEDGRPDQPKQAPSAAPAVVSQSGRFRGARRSLGRFAASGSRKDLESGLGHYVRSGLGGATQGARRMGGTARVAGRLFGGLEGFRARETRPSELGLDRAALTGKPAREVGDRIIDAVCPVDGSQDTEARRDSLSRSISEVAEQFADLDMTALTPEQIDLLIERFVAYDVCHRIELDVGKAIFEKAPDYAAAVKRIEDMRQYVREKISASFRARVKRGQRLTRSATATLTARVIQDTMMVFEDYIR